MTQISTVTPNSEAAAPVVTAAELAERIKALKAAHMVETAPDRLTARRIDAEEPVTARIRRLPTRCPPHFSRGVTPSYQIGRYRAVLAPDPPVRISAKHVNQTTLSRQAPQNPVGPLADPPKGRDLLPPSVVSFSRKCCSNGASTPHSSRYTAWMPRSKLIQAQTFSGHESFPLRFTWLAKAVRGCEPQKQRDLFSRDDAIVRLGVGKNMVRSIRYWAVNTAVLEDDTPAGRTGRHRPSLLGELLFGTKGRDPFIEDPGTVWLLHWQLAINRRLGTWFWLFNELRATEFSKSDVIRSLAVRASQPGSKQLAVDTIERDLDCLLRTYVPSDPDKRLSREELLDCPLTELGLIRRAGDRDSFAFVRGSHSSLPPAVFVYALLDFWQRVAPTADSLRFDQIAFGAGSPGIVFKLSENAVIDRLDAISRDSASHIRFDETAGNRQVFRVKRADSLAYLRRHYGSRR